MACIVEVICCDNRYLQKISNNWWDGRVTVTLVEVTEQVCHCLNDVGELGLSQLHSLVVHEEVAFFSYLKHITGNIK